MSSRGQWPKRVRWLLILALVVGCLGWLVLFLCCSGTTRFRPPSDSSRTAQWRGIYVCPVELEPLDTAQTQAFFPPTEAWVETVWEYYESVGIRRKVAGEWLCVRFEDSSGKHDDLLFSRSRMNGIESGGPTGNRDGVTFTFVAGGAQFFPSDPNATLPTSGELTFCDRNQQRESRYRYRIKR